MKYKLKFVIEQKFAIASYLFFKVCGIYLTLSIAQKYKAKHIKDTIGVINIILDSIKYFILNKNIFLKTLNFN